MTAGNDVVDLSKWNGTGSVNIGDIFSSDNDKVTVMAGALQKNNLKLTSIENLEIVNSNVKTSVVLNGANFKGLEAIKLIGDATDLNVSQLTQGVKIDATADADTITGSDKADTINGGAGNDIIRAGSGNDVLTGGNGADTFIVGSVQSLGIDKILDFSAEDKISMNGFVPGELKKFDASTFSTVNYKTLDSVLATFGPGGANVTKAGDVVIFSYDGKTYALLANGAFDERTDALVDITGANVASLTESNFGESSLYTYNNYTDFTNAITNGVRIPDGEAIIKTMTVTDAGNLAIDNNLLAKVANGGIKEITDGNTITVGVPVNGGIGEFDARIFDSKLGADVVGVTLNINGSNNSDIIYASKLGGTINGSGGADRITLNDGVDTVAFESIASANGLDTITNFTAEDKLDFKAFATLTVGDLNVGSAAAQSLSANNIYQTTMSSNITSNNYGSGGSSFGDLFATSGKPFTTGITSGGKALIVVKGNDETQIYYVNDTGSDGTVASTDVDLVAVISNNSSGVTLDNANFVLA